MDYTINNTPKNFLILNFSTNPSLSDLAKKIILNNRHSCVSQENAVFDDILQVLDKGSNSNNSNNNNNPLLNKLNTNFDVIITIGSTSYFKEDNIISKLHKINAIEIDYYKHIFHDIVHENFGATKVFNTAGFVLDKKLIFCLPSESEAIGIGIGEIIVYLVRGIR